MRVSAPGPGIEFETSDIHGEPFKLSDHIGKGILLAFFRDAACPFCQFRLYELGKKHKSWNRAGLEIVAVFSSPSQQIRDHVARHPRPFRIISDPRLKLYNKYGVEQDPAAIPKALLFHLPRLFRGLKTGGRPRKHPNWKIVPANFIIDTDGRVVDTWYGRDAADHMPLGRIQSFVDELTGRRLKALQKENRKLKKTLLKLKKRE